jgi:quercetin dioxygenase-like cupin family protein
LVLKHVSEVPVQAIEGLEGVSKQILIGKDDGSEEVVVRCFRLEPGSATLYHSHDFPHLVKVEEGEGVVIDADENEHPLHFGRLVYVPDNEEHSFKNTGMVPFVFLCIVPGRGEK